MKKTIALLLSLMMVVSLSACGGGTTSATEAPKAETQAQTQAEVKAETKAEVEAVAEAEAPVEDLAAPVKEAIERNAKRTGLQTEWDGPTTGPKAATGKKIAIINANAEVGAEKKWGDATEEACKRIGWEYITLDGKGTVQGQLDAINQAISMKVDGIYTSADAASLQSGLEAATAAGIPVIGVHSAGTPGSHPELNLYYNCSSAPEDIGKAVADFVIADCNGKGRVIVLYDAQYAIARAKAEAMKAGIETCPEMEVLEYTNSPLSEITTQMPQLTSSWVSKYGSEPFYVVSICDAYYDFVASTLQSGGVDTNLVKLVGTDGTEAAYDRVRKGEYQIGTVPEPGTLFGYMVVDEFNRSFNGEEPYLYTPNVYVVNENNIDAEGGDQGLFIPSSGFADKYAAIWGVD